ncbi:unnamed protein product, partial [marine sediment metagenome]
MVICDRFGNSTLAYQGYGRELGLSTAEVVNNLATQGLKPALIIFLDLLPERGLARKQILEDHFE